MALRARLELRFSQQIFYDNFSYFTDELDNEAEYRHKGLTFIDWDNGHITWYTDIRLLEIHDSQISATASEQHDEFWTMGDLTCRFQGDDAIVATARKVYELAREYFAPIKYRASMF